jgi:hypothetical protein
MSNDEIISDDQIKTIAEEAFPTLMLCRGA